MRVFKISRFLVFWFSLMILFSGLALAGNLEFNVMHLEGKKAKVCRDKGKVYRSPRDPWVSGLVLDRDNCYKITKKDKNSLTHA